MTPWPAILSVAMLSFTIFADVHPNVLAFAAFVCGWNLALLYVTRGIDKQEKPVAWRKALEFYADPFAWKKKHDPENDVQVPDFYSETSFGDMASEALATHPPAQPDISAEEP